MLIALNLLVWLVGSCVRIYQQARYYQIEEYKDGRYLSWWLAKRDRWLPKRAVITSSVGMALAFLLSESPDSLLPGIILLFAAIIAVMPPDEGEIKKRFIRTQRATRLLTASFVIAAISLMVLTGFASLLSLIQSKWQAIVITVIGLITFIGSPILLLLGNLLVKPIEAILRRRYIRSAR